MMLQVTELSQRFGGVHALRNVSFTLAPNELVGLIGPNGSGKSTLMNVISGVLKATRGTVLFRGVEITGKRTVDVVRSGIARTFQSPRLFWTLSVRRNIEIAELEFPRRSDLMRLFIDEHMPELKALLDHRAQTLSLFQQKKLEIALHLASRPSLILLDEPAAGLSPSEQNDLVGILKAVNSASCAVIVIEHSMHVIFQSCPRVLVLHGGTLIADAEPSEIAKNDAVIEAYLGPGAAELLR